MQQLNAKYEKNTILLPILCVIGYSQTKTEIFKKGASTPY
jgi:hypothetical protein